MRRRLHELWTDQNGLTSVEYALLLATVAVMAIGAFAYLGSRTEGMAGNSAGVISGLDGDTVAPPMRPSGYR